MFRDVPECSGMFHVLGFIDARYYDAVGTLLSTSFTPSYSHCIATGNTTGI